MVKRKIAIEQMAREIAELEGCGDTATSCRQSNCACMDHARAALAALEMTIPGLAAVLDGADTVIRVTPKELHRAFVRGDTGIIGEASFVSADMNDHGDGDEAAIDGDVNFSRLAEWLNSRFRHTIARSEMVNSPFDPAGQDTPRWFAWPIAPFRFFWRQ